MGSISIISSYLIGLKISIDFIASAAVYNGGNASLPSLFLFLFLHSISISCICPLSGNIIEHKSQVAFVAYIGLLYPSLYNFGILPEWSMCACVKSIKSISFTSNKKGSEFFISSFVLPWYIPQSTINFFPAPSTKKLDPVTVFVAPKKVIFIVFLH